ncbi:hypothetical protein NP590_09715 [Methylomonas sp. SURF-2]|uniref:Uncharacterized protein n=1 Tax=Methylomonas subterranea TaxID=2952225 RepID=A0ABT1TFZ5_9GAMM|nr:hypothetical protein [Methylomonas sp. SURF-2]MCQ8104378.1 hypothetical protein [Methylomonas sp. SURF-2]
MGWKGRSFLITGGYHKFYPLATVYAKRSLLYAKGIFCLKRVFSAHKQECSWQAIIPWGKGAISPVCLLVKRTGIEFNNHFVIVET